MVEPRGLEPLTPCLQSRCATNCAKAPWSDSPRYSESDAIGGLCPGVLGGAASAGESPDDTGDREPDGHELLHDASDLESDSGPSWT